MSQTVTITTLVENTVNIGGLRAEHGLCLLIRAGGKKVLFDTGQSDLLLDNARKMGLGLEDAAAVVLSHGHYDHTGGIQPALRVAPAAKVFCHPAALKPKFTANSDGRSRFVGMPPDAVAQLSSTGQICSGGKTPTEIIPDVFTTGEIPRRNTFEDTGGPFFLDESCSVPDPLIDDQALYFDTPKGLVAVLGCAHAGAINTLDHIRELTGARPVWAVIGGMHLLSAGAERMDKTIEGLRRFSPKKIVVAHCTGSQAFARLSAAFPEACSICPVGTSLVFHR